MAKKCCVFVDGENFRHTIVDLFDGFNQSDYLPKQADWGNFFDWLVTQVTPNGERVRTYWYVIQHVDFFPYKIPRAQEMLKTLLRKNRNWKAKIDSLSGEQLTNKLKEYSEELHKTRTKMERRAKGWSEVQNAISMNHPAVEFRREGSIRYDLFKRTLGREKAVDVKLAVDMITLQDIYDIAIIVSGDQDYVPAVRKLKDHGKRVVNIAFRTRGGKLLPGGARRLNQVTDDRVAITYEQFAQKISIST